MEKDHEFSNPYVVAEGTLESVEEAYKK